jgi:hypothetical protein
MAMATELADLRRAALAAAEAERAIVVAIAAARAKGARWDDVGHILGTTGEGARQRYGKAVPAKRAAAPVSKAKPRTAAPAAKRKAAASKASVRKASTRRRQSTS